MIQKTTPRQSSSQAGSSSRSNRSGHPEAQQSWGSWANNKHYSLEVAQHPLRARMCGFGDKDRRPLAPAAVAKMIVRDQQNNLVDVDDIDVAFFLVTVDLWDETLKTERNLVLHPSSGERYAPSSQSKPRKPRTSESTAPQSRSERQSPAPPSQFYNRTDPTGLTPLHTPSSSYQTSSFPFPGDPSMPYPPSYPSDWPSYTHSSPTSSPAQGGYGPAPVLRPVQSLTGDRASSPRATSPHGESGPWSSSDSNKGSRSDPSYRGWPLAYPDNSTSDGRDPWDTRYSQPYFAPVDGLYAPPQAFIPPAPSASSPALPPTGSAPPAGDPSLDDDDEGDAPHPPRQLYTRTLVGPLAANACRLLDQHRVPGIFFLFQDLSIRTEGTFRLRLRLMNVGAPPGPDPGANRVNINTSSVLAQTFSDPFVVYSAKRFPGVPDTTALSIAFGNQGQKLPLRNKLGSGKHRRPGDSSDSD